MIIICNALSNSFFFFSLKVLVSLPDYFFSISFFGLQLITSTRYHDTYFSYHRIPIAKWASKHSILHQNCLTQIFKRYFVCIFFLYVIGNHGMVSDQVTISSYGYNKICILVLRTIFSLSLSFHSFTIRGTRWNQFMCVCVRVLISFQWILTEKKLLICKQLKINQLRTHTVCLQVDLVRLC